MTTWASTPPPLCCPLAVSPRSINSRCRSDVGIRINIGADVFSLLPQFHNEHSTRLDAKHDPRIFFHEAGSIHPRQISFIHCRSEIGHYGNMTKESLITMVAFLSLRELRMHGGSCTFREQRNTRFCTQIERPQRSAEFSRSTEKALQRGQLECMPTRPREQRRVTFGV